MIATAARVARVKTALAEVLENRHLFSEEAYNEIILALNEKLHGLQSVVQAQPSVTDTDEIRLVTVMFVDVANSTHLARNLDVEWKAMIGEVHRQIANVVENWDGEVGQYLGDGVLCFFGAHRSRDDDAARAVSCALAIQKMADEFSPQVFARYGVEFSLRIGISSGRVVVGVIGTGTKSEFVAMGTTTNLAARLQHLCPPKQVLIDSHTYHRVRDRFIMQQQTPARLKGFDSLVDYYLVTARRRHRSELLTGEPIAGISLPFVGRALEHRKLIDLIDDALAEGQFHAISIFGEIGVGKSRLLQEALASLGSRPFHILSMVARYEKRAVSHNLLADLLTDFCELSEGATSTTAEMRILNSIAEVVPEADAEAVAVVMGRMIGYEFADYPNYDLDPQEAVARWLRALVGQGALLLAVDNLHWADAASLQLLEYLAVAMVDYSAVLVTTARPEFRATRGDFLAMCARFTEITLGKLSDAATIQLIDSVLAHVDHPPPLLAQRICERSEGNPLFVEEFLRMLFDTGVFEPSGEGRWRVNLYHYSTMSTELPSGLLGVFQARLDDLPGISRRVVQVASVIGQIVWQGAVSHLCGFDAGAVLDDLVARNILVLQPEHTLENQREFRFRHSLYREVAYAMLTRTDREAYHQRAAEWMAAFVLERPDLLGALAEHLVQGQKREQALSIYLAAAEDRIRRGLAAETLKLVEGGLASARDVPREIALPLVSQLWMLQGQALIALKRYEEATAAGQTALMLMDELPAGDLCAEREIAARVLEDANEHLARLECSP